MISRRLLRIKVLKEIYSFLNAGNSSIENAEKELVFSIQKTYDLYHYLMNLIVEIADYGSQQQGLAKQKNMPTEEERNPNTKFVDNAFIRLISENKALNKYCEKRKLNWRHTPEVIKRLHHSLLASDYYKAYMQHSQCSFEEDRSLVIKFYENELEDSETLLSVLEEQNIYWNDDVEFCISQIIKTLKSFKENQSEDTPLMPLYKDSNDESFALNLLTTAATHNAEYREMIDKHTKNWDVERIAFMDIVIMITAIAEMVEFPNIPIKVSLNEYIEIAKYYSTPNSSTFINGVLDKIVAELKTNNIIVKQGRGLIE
jgi:N utilization substance protein B